MIKKISTILIFLFIFYLGYLFNHYKFKINKIIFFISNKKNSNKQLSEKNYIKITPTPTINITNFLKINDKGSITYNDPINKVSFQYPAGFVIYGSPCSIQIEKFFQVPHGAMTNHIHIAIIPKIQKSNCNWTIYLEQEKKYQSLLKLDVGEKISLSDTQGEFFTYERLSDELLGKNKFKHFINYKVWESSENTEEHIFQLETIKYQVWIMGLINENVEQIDHIPYNIFKNIVSSFSIN